MRALALALQLLTRLPVPGPSRAPSPEELGQSVALFPVVGLLLGTVLAGGSAALWWADPGVLAALALTAWALVTGGLHLDGLADLADAWIGGQGDRDRTLALMKDPHSGPMALMAVALVLLSKFAALQALLAHGSWMALLLAPVLGRAAIVALLLTTPYVRPQGLGAPYASHLPRWSCGLLVLLSAAAAPVFLGWPGVAALAALCLTLIGLRRALLARLGGVTGDTLGAGCELGETLVLLVVALGTP